MVVFLFILGAIIGSFLNVVALRWDKKSSLEGRSECPHCHKQLGWWELIPILSFIILRGRCSKCKESISPQYISVEILTGVVFATVFNLEFSFFKALSLPFLVSFILTLSVLCIYIVISIIDFRTTYIPDKLSYAATIIALTYRIFIGHGTLLDWLAGPILFAFFALIWLISRGRAMGFGDAKLGLSIGLLLGLPLGLSALVLSFWTGTVVTLSLMAIQKLRSAQESLSSDAKGLTMRSEIPFAPFMCLGAWMALVLSLDLFHVLSL